MFILKAIVPWGILAALLSAAATFFWIRFSRKEEWGQEIREEGNKAHYKKKGTPTMGGVAFTAIFLLLLLFVGRGNVATLLIAICTLGFGAIGFLDDWEKVKKRESEGLTPRQKLLLQFAFAAVLLSVHYFFTPAMAVQTIPFFGWQWKLGLFSIPLLAFIMVGTVNAVNLTDGLDGLCAGVSLPVFLLLAFLSGYNTVQEGSVAVAAILFAGVLTGFLFFNSHPASLFMGDTGSMAIGGALSAILMVMNRLPFLLVLGGIYLMEALSVILQVAYFKRTGGKRIFLMSPIHHHFELKGYPEEKVTMAFTLASVLLCMLSVWIW